MSHEKARDTHMAMQDFHMFFQSLLNSNIPKYNFYSSVRYYLVEKVHRVELSRSQNCTSSTGFLLKFTAFIVQKKKRWVWLIVV